VPQNNLGWSVAVSICYHNEMPTTSKSSNLAPRLVKIKQAAAYLAISPWKLRNLVQQGMMRYIEDGGGTSPWRFDVRDLDEYIDRNRQRL